MLWRTLGALLLGAVVALAVGNAVIALGGDDDPRPPDAIHLAPDRIGDPDVEPPVPTTRDAGEPVVAVPPPVHLDPAPPPAPPPPASASPGPVAPPPPPPELDDDDDFDDDDFDDEDDGDDD